MMNAERRKKLKARKKNIEDSKSGGSMIFIKPDKTIRVRPLPVHEDEEFGLEVVHFFLGNDIKGVISPKTFDMPCAIYERYKELSEGDDDDKELAAKMKPKRRYVVPVIKYEDLKGKKVDEKTGVKLLFCTGQVYQKMIDYSLDSEHGDFTDPIKGYDFKITRTGSGQHDTEYACINSPKTPLAKKYRKVYDVKEMLQKEIPSYEKTQELIAKYLNEDKPRKDKVIKKKKKKKPSDS